MAINLHICDARVWRALSKQEIWYVGHPENDAILATCGTREEAAMVREFLNDLPRQLRNPEYGTLHTGVPVTVDTPLIERPETGDEKRVRRTMEAIRGAARKLREGDE